MVMPKLMDTNDPEFAEMQKNSIFNTATNGDTPDISEVSCLRMISSIE